MYSYIAASCIIASSNHEILSPSSVLSSMKTPIAQSRLFFLQSIPGGFAVLITSFTWLLVSLIGATNLFAKIFGQLEIIIFTLKVSKPSLKLSKKGFLLMSTSYIINDWHILSLFSSCVYTQNTHNIRTNAHNTL